MWDDLDFVLMSVILKSNGNIYGFCFSAGQTEMIIPVFVVFALYVIIKYLIIGTEVLKSFLTQ